MQDIHCLKSVRIRCFSEPYFPAFGLNMERYSVSLRIYSEIGKIPSRKTPNMDTFHAVVATIKLTLFVPMFKRPGKCKKTCAFRRYLNGALAQKGLIRVH